MEEIMRIEVDEKWVLETDSRQFILFQPGVSTDKEGNETEIRYQPKYQASLPAILNTYLNQKILESDAKTWRRLKKEIEAVKKVIEEIRDELVIK